MVKPKKYLGQHFLKDESISLKIAASLIKTIDYNTIIEIGPGTGALTKFLLERQENLIALEVDDESIDYLKVNYPTLDVRKEDFLKFDFSSYSNEKIAIAGNFPYNISSQILFKVLDEKDKVVELVGMFQKEVAQRVAEKPGTKRYGIISVFIQAYFDVEYLFSVDEHVFEPPPKVKSGVIRLTRNNTTKLSCNEQLFKSIVKATFNQRRKMIRNTVKSFVGKKIEDHPLFVKRPEQLSVEDFIVLTNFLETLMK
tara:strand:+ start:186 stop:950 length:765 start_codon:yes stop_codon:yes gene_type:complete